MRLNRRKIQVKEVYASRCHQSTSVRIISKQNIVNVISTSKKTTTRKWSIETVEPKVVLLLFNRIITSLLKLDD